MSSSSSPSSSPSPSTSPSSSFHIHRNLSPLDKLASQTQQTIQQTNKQKNQNNLSINSSVFASSFLKTPSSSFSLTPLTSNYSNQPNLPQHGSQPPPNCNSLKFTSALSQLTDSFNQLDNQLPVHPRRPSTGRVPCSTATTQTPREHIPSYYGDQHSISSFESFEPQRQSQYSHQHVQSDDPQLREVLKSSPPNNHQHRLDHHSNSSESESEIDTQSTHYPSGLSLVSEDPFQYRGYEASRESRQPPSNPPPIVAPTRPVNPPTSERSTNFSRPLRQVTALPSDPPPQPTSSSITFPGTDPPARDYHTASQNWTGHRDSESQYSASGDYLADTRDILTKGKTAQFESTRSKRSDSKASSLRSFGRAARASIQSRSSIDTTSSNGSRLSWKKLFDFGSDSNERTPVTQDNNSPLHSSDPSSLCNNLPEIVFSQSDAERNSSYQHQQKPNNFREMSRSSPRVEVGSLHQTSRQRYNPEDGHGLTPNHHMDSQNKRSNRLSIYSLPSSDDLAPAQLAQRQGYASRSPVTFDGSDSSQVPSPVSDEVKMGNRQLDQPRMRSHEISTQQQPPTRPVSSVYFRNSNNGTQLHSAIQKAKATLAVSNPKGYKSHQGQTAQDYLQAGIEAHERGDLERSAGLFERAAREGGGCGAGMLMWGLSLRHGWGCQVNEVRAFKWLQKAAESVIDDLDTKAKNATSVVTNNPSIVNSNGDHDQVAKSELILAIYELGQCFMRGWGCKKDKQLAISYFELAAKLGDPDAQQELGFCYTNGKGTKKDLKLAAKYYRMAAQQGVEMMGSQWIWKDKYN